MAELNASKSGTFRVGGDIEVNRLGFGAMRVTGPGIWGPPKDRSEAVRTLRRAPKLGINFIDTANSYGPHVSEELIREVLYPYDGILVATKAGFRRPSAARGSLMGGPTISAPRRSPAATGLAWKRSGFGNCIASIRQCRGLSSLPPSARCSMTASSAMPA